MSIPKYKFIQLTDGTKAQAMCLVDQAGNVLAPGGGTMVSYTVTETLIDGDNVIAHNLNKEIIYYTVKTAAGAFVAAGGDDTDLNNFTINISGGGPLVGAQISLIYNV